MSNDYLIDEYFDSPVEINFEDEENFYDPENDSLEHTAWHVAEWYLEDYSFDDLLEEFDVIPEAAFVAIVLAGLIEEDDLENYLTSDR